MVDLNKGIRREVTRLSERWSALLVHASQWQAKLDDMLPVSSFKIFKMHIGCIIIKHRNEWISFYTLHFQSFLQKVHTFQKSLEAVLQRLGEVEIGQKTLENAGNIAGTENEILLFRNQLKVCKYTLIYNECIHCLPRNIFLPL